MLALLARCEKFRYAFFVPCNIGLSRIYASLLLSAIGLASANARAVKSAALPAERNEYKLELANGETLKILVKCPQAKQAARLPVVVLFGGFNTGARAIELVDLEAPYCLLTFAYPITVARKPSFSEAIALLPEGKRAIHATIEGIHRVVAWVKTRPELDPERIVLVGASFGAPFVTIAAGEGAPVKALILVHAFGDIPGAIAHRLEASWSRKLGGLAKWLAKPTALFLWWYADAVTPEASLAKLQPGQKLLLLSAANDDIVPIKAIQVLRESLQKSPVAWEEKVLPGAHLRPGERELIQALLRESIAWLKSEGIFGAQLVSLPTLPI